MTYTKITILIKDTPPYFVGSQLRGGLGHALKKVTCINPSSLCEGCFASSNCLYHEFYEAKNEFHKYRFDFELGLGYYDFSFYLFDSATAKLPYIVSAFHMLFNHVGLGKEKKFYPHYEMFINDQNMIINNQIKLPKDPVKTFEINSLCKDVIIHFVTPLRIKKENRYLRNDELTLEIIINSAYQRQMKLLGRDYKKFPYQITGDIVEKDLHFQELTRYSNRQKTDMNLGGIVGKMTIKNLNTETWNVLKLAELLAVGKSTVFGLGKITLENING